MNPVSPPFTRVQLLASLTREVAMAQASFQSMQLAAWYELAPGSAAPSIGELAAVSEWSLEMDVKPHDPGLFRTWWRKLFGGASPALPGYHFCESTDRGAVRVTLKVGRKGEAYEVSVKPEDVLG